MNDLKPVSVRLTDQQKQRLRELGNGSIAKGVVYLLENFKESPKAEKVYQDLEQVRKKLESMKKSKISFDKKVIRDLEKKYENALNALKSKEISDLDSNIEQILKVIS